MILVSLGCLIGASVAFTSNSINISMSSEQARDKLVSITVSGESKRARNLYVCLSTSDFCWNNPIRGDRIRFADHLGLR